MPQITPEFDGQTVITTFEMTPGTCYDLLEELKDAASGPTTDTEESP